MKFATAATLINTYTRHEALRDARLSGTGISVAERRKHMKVTRIAPDQIHLWGHSGALHGTCSCKNVNCKAGSFMKLVGKVALLEAADSDCSDRKFHLICGNRTRTGNDLEIGSRR